MRLGFRPRSKVLLQVLLGVGAFLATLAWTGHVLPPHLHIATFKRLHYEAHADDYSAVFIGSSRVYREAVPAAFEKAMAAHGSSQRLFNFGAPGMELPESVFLLERILEAAPSRLQWVFVELHDASMLVDDRNFLADREVSWHDTPSTLRAAHGVLDSDLGSSEKLTQLLGHGRQFVYRRAGVGRARGMIPGLLDTGLTLENYESADYLQRQGWLPLEVETGAHYALRRQLLQRNPRLFRQNLAALEQQRALHERQPDHPDVPVYDAYERACVDRMLQLMQGHAARLVFVVMPQMRDETQFKQAHADGAIPDLIVLNDPARFPELYGIEQWFDPSHLGRAASRRCMQLFVDELDRVVGID
jgi:hypothetical protein